MVEETLIEVLDLPTHIETNIAHPKATEEEAYRVYVTTGARSLRRTATLLGIPHGTILSWSQRNGWRQRMVDTDLEVTEGIADAAAAAVVMQQLKNVEYLASVRDDPGVDTKDRTAAAKALMAEFKDISASIVKSTEDVEELEDAELERMVQSEEGLAVLLARQRARVGIN